jgi:flavin reductase (DIM6/NTAB) family NADH-FMN oxidoreductase RutF
MARVLGKLERTFEVIVNPGQELPQNIYKMLIGMVVPRPIAFVSTVSRDGIRNLAPFSFFTVVSANPPVICFAPMRNSRGLMKDTLRNIEETREFTVNVVSEEFVQQMNMCSGEYGPEIDEFEISRLTPVASDLVAPPRVGESKASMECKLLQIVEASAQPLGGSLVLGEVLRFHVADAVIENFRVDPDALNAVGRMGGPAYTRTKDRFDIARPVVK